MKPKLGDIILAGSLLLVAAGLALGLFLFAPAGEVAVVTLDGTELTRLSLREDTVLTLDTGHVITVKEGSLTVTKAPCPDLICAHHAPISREGETIVCLPYELVITVEKGGLRE